MRKLGSVLGLLNQEPEYFLQKICNVNSNMEEIHFLIKKRNNARKNKNWIAADEVRCHLKKMGVILEDGVDKTTWRRVKTKSV